MEFTIIWFFGAFVTIYLYNEAIHSMWGAEFFLLFLTWPLCLGLLLIYMLHLGFKTLHEENSFTYEYLSKPSRRENASRNEALLKETEEALAKIDAAPMKSVETKNE